jgi:hypothetical protein
MEWMGLALLLLSAAGSASSNLLLRRELLPRTASAEHVSILTPGAHLRIEHPRGNGRFVGSDFFLAVIDAIVQLGDPLPIELQSIPSPTKGRIRTVGVPRPGQRTGSPVHTVSRTLQIFLNRSSRKRIAPRRTYRNPIAVALEWQAMIDGGQVGSRAALARRLGVSRARVTQVLQLLTLAPTVIDAIVQLGDPLSEPVVSERSLRQLVSMDHPRQVRWLARGTASGSHSWTP